MHTEHTIHRADYTTNCRMISHTESIKSSDVTYKTKKHFNNIDKRNRTVLV